MKYALSSSNKKQSNRELEQCLLNWSFHYETLQGYDVMKVVRQSSHTMTVFWKALL